MFITEERSEDGVLKDEDPVRTRSMDIKPELFVVRQYDGVNNEWIDLSQPVALEEANQVWLETTAYGTRNAMLRLIIIALLNTVKR